jgi:hypothetical protein
MIVLRGDLILGHFAEELCRSIAAVKSDFELGSTASVPDWEILYSAYMTVSFGSSKVTAS